MTNDINMEDILDEFTMEEPLNHAVLKRYIDTYPGLALELTDLYHELVLTDARNAMENEQLKTKQLTSTTAPACAVLETALAGDELRSLARKVGLPRDFFAGFRDRKVRLGSIPEPVVTGLACELGVAVHALVNFLRSQPRTNTGFAFKADGKPDEGAVLEYSEFIDSLGLSDQEERALDRLCKVNGRS
jgi:hypothetical protein